MANRVIFNRDDYKLFQSPPFLAKINNYDQAKFGKDDSRPNGKLNAWIFKFVNWENTEAKSAKKTALLILAVIGVSFTCLIGIGFYVFYQHRNLHRKIPVHQDVLNYNLEERLQVVKALGGDEVCQKIPTIALNFKEYPLNPILEPHRPYCAKHLEQVWIFQGIDPVGRCYVGLRVIDKKTNEICTGLLFQNYHEKDLRSTWVGTGFFSKYPYGDQINLLERIMLGKDEDYQLDCVNKNWAAENPF